MPAPATPVARGNANADIRGDYELAERVGTREAWDSFLVANPSGFYADLARAQRNKLAAEAARVSATEKARAAAEEQARLTVEGAKASEQARAAAQSKAAEEARLAAEKKKQLEDAKLAVAEQAKAVAQAKAADDAEKARLAEAAKIALAKRSEPKEDRSNAGKSADPAVASLAPSDTKPEKPAPQDIPRLLQTELRRVGCKTGEIDGEWSASSRRALSLFNDNAGTRLDVKLASLDALDVVRSRTGRVCPLDCERGYRANGDSCVKITCDSDQVAGPDGTCHPRPEHAQKAVSHNERKSPASPAGRSRCFAFNGKQFCE